MHLVLLLLVIVGNWLLRAGISPADTPQSRAAQAWRLITFPPLSLSAVAIAIIWMGNGGTMAGGVSAWLSYGLSWLWLLGAAVLLARATWLSWKNHRQIQRYPTIQLQAIEAKLVDHPLAFCGQVGFWRPHLLVTQGLLERLNPEQLQAAIAHEQAHHHYRDHFWFFWLSWLKQLGSFWPNGEFLWQEMLLFRESRADAKASQSVDRLVLAEALLLVVAQPYQDYSGWGTPLSLFVGNDRLQRRVNLLLHPEPLELPTHTKLWAVAALLPLALIPFHH